MSSGLSMRCSASSEIWINPSISSSSCANTPKLVMFTTFPCTTDPTLYLFGTSIHGSGSICLSPNEIFCCAGSILKTMTSTSSLSLRTSRGSTIRFSQERSEIWIKPSIPSSISTKAPKLVRLRTRPVSFVPTGYFVSKSSQGFGCSCFSPRDSFWLSLSISRTTASITSSLATTFDGAIFRRVHDISDIWMRPSTPSSNSRNAP